MNETSIAVLQTLEKYKVYIGIGVGVALAIGIGVSVLVKGKTMKVEASWSSFWNVNNDLALALQQQRTAEKERNAALTTAVESYNYVKENLSTSKVMPWVLFQLGNAYFQLQNYDDAIREYRNFLSKYRRHPLTPLVKQSLGYAYEEKGQYQDAVEQFEDPVVVNTAFLAAQEGWDAGRCYEKLGKTKDAIRTYKKTIQISPDSLWAKMAQYRLSALK